MNAQEYNDNINCLLSDSSVYTKLSKNQIRSLKSHLMSINMYETFSKKISKVKYHFLHCSKGVTPRFYGLPSFF